MTKDKKKEDKKPEADEPVAQESGVPCTPSNPCPGD